MRARPGATLAVAMVASVASAQAVNDVAAQIRACTRTIESAQATREARLDAQAARGVLFIKIGQFDLAIVDLSEVLRVRSQADDVYAERGTAYAVVDGMLRP